MPLTPIRGRQRQESAIRHGPDIALDPLPYSSNDHTCSSVTDTFNLAFIKYTANLRSIRFSKSTHTIVPIHFCLVYFHSQPFLIHSFNISKPSHHIFLNSSYYILFQLTKYSYFLLYLSVKPHIIHVLNSNWTIYRRFHGTFSK